MRTVLAIVLCLACACTGTRTGNPGHNGDLPSGVVVAASELAREENPTLSTGNAETFGMDNRAFAFALYHELAKQPGNLFVSPYSISSALAMTYAAAKGVTATEMAEALHFTLPQSELHAAFNATNLSLAKRKDQLVPSSGAGATIGNGFELRVVNQAWGQKDYKFLDSYLDLLAVNYGAGMYLLDFTKTEASRETINDWVADHTEQRIKDLLPKDSIHADTALVLTNAIYFKANWLDKFDAAATKPGTFTAESGARNVDMMHAEADVQYAMVDGYQAVALPYISPDVGMLVVLPPEGRFADTAGKLDATLVDSLRSNLGSALVTLSLPKWTFESEHTLKAALQVLGMNAAFDSRAADLSGMDGMPGHIYIDDVYHKAFIAVDEEGTEAAAATAVVFHAASLPPHYTLAFDRPFMFVVYDRPTGQLLFLGHLADPG
jgi:serpin B